MKILQFGKFYHPTFGGMEHVIYDITEGLNTDGDSCDVLCSNNKRVYEESSYKNYTVYRTSSYGVVASTSITPQLVSKLWKIHKNYDIIHVHHPDPMAFIALFLVRPKCKIVIHWHSDIIRQRKILKLFLPLQNWVLNYSDKIIATSANYAQHSLHLKKFKDKIEIIPIGIAHKTFISNECNVQAIKNKYKNRKIIFGLGRLVSYKGFIYLVESAKYFNDDFVILIGGVGPEKEKLLDVISENNLQDKVKMLGYLNPQEKYDYFQASFLFCLPSITKAEAFGVVLIEAMTFSKPIVSTRLLESGMSWVNENDVSGLQVDPESSEQLAKAFEQIASDKKFYELLCVNSFKRYQDLFTRGKMITSLKELYRSII